MFSWTPWSSASSAFEEILDADGGFRLGGAKRRAVAALLLLDANQVVSTERLVDGVWGDDPPAAATGSLQNHVLRLRRELGDRLVTRAPGYVLRVEPGELDLDRFRRRVDDAAPEGRSRRRPCSARRSRCGAARRSPI